MTPRPLTRSLNQNQWNEMLRLHNAMVDNVADLGPEWKIDLSDQAMFERWDELVFAVCRTEPQPRGFLVRWRDRLLSLVKHEY